MSPLWWGGLAASSWHGKMNGKLRDHIFNFKREAEKERKEEVKRGYGISKPARRDLLPSARTNLPNISKQHQQRESRYSSTWTGGGHSHHSIPPLPPRRPWPSHGKMNSAQLQKSSKSFSVSTLFKVLSLFWDPTQSLPVKPVKSKGRVCTHNIQWHRICLPIPKMGKRA